MLLFETLVGARPVRSSVDRLFGQYARLRVRRLDRLDVVRQQQATLLQLVRQARDTRFGRQHGFEHIHSMADYRQRVPLNDYEGFWRDWWQPSYPDLANVTWPQAIPYFALSSGTTSGTTKYIPVSRQMLASNRKAALTTLALYRHSYPESPLFTGRIFFLGGSTSLREARSVAGKACDSSRGRPRPACAQVGDLSGIAAREVSAFLRPYTFPPRDLALMSDWEEKIQVLAERSARLPVTVLSGIPSWLLFFFAQLKRRTGHARIIDIWPTLRLLVHGGIKFDPYRQLLRQEIGSDTVRFLETYPCSEGFVAAEDPRFDLLRLIPDHGIFFEFVPVEELDCDRPARHSVAEIETGVHYAVALTTCAGLWSYLVGDTVCFEKRHPPLLRFTGRTRYFLSAFGEHLISEEVEQAIATAAEQSDSAVVDFHVGPVFPDQPGQVGRHRYLVEFARPPADLGRFAHDLDGALRKLNEDYDAHRQGDLTLLAPDVVPVRPGGFAAWLRAKGKLGGQHKLPRMDNTGQLTSELSLELNLGGWLDGTSAQATDGHAR